MGDTADSFQCGRFLIIATRESQEPSSASWIWTFSMFTVMLAENPNLAPEKRSRNERSIIENMLGMECSIMPVRRQSVTKRNVIRKKASKPHCLLPIACVQSPSSWSLLLFLISVEYLYSLLPLRNPMSGVVESQTIHFLWWWHCLFLLLHELEPFLGHSSSFIS